MDLLSICIIGSKFSG